MAKMASVLKGVFSALDPATFQQRQQQLGQAETQGKEQNRFLAEVIIKGIQTGTVPQQEGAQALQKLGFPELLTQSNAPPEQLTQLGGGPPRQPTTETIFQEGPTLDDSYFTTKRITLNEDGKEQVYEVPFDARAGQFLMDRRQLSEKTPETLGEQSRAKSAGRTEGEERTLAKLDIPKMQSNAQYLKGLVNKALEHPGFSSVVGMPSLGKGMQFVSGSSEAGFRALQQQIEGKQFMQAYETLKGGGQITEIEGRKATEALSRLRSAVSEDEYRIAAEEFITEIDRLTRLAEQRAGQKPQAGGWSIEPVQ
mgnify:CR=1 FL=1